MTTFIKSHLISQSSSGIFHYNFEVISPLYLKLGLDSEKHINPKSLQYIMGHSDINITMNPYAHVSVDSVKSEVVKYFIYIFEVAHGSQEPDLTGVQVVSRPHGDQISRRHYGDRRSERLGKIEYFGCHPCINTSTLLMKTSDVKEKILPALGHEYQVVELPTE